MIKNLDKNGRCIIHGDKPMTNKEISAGLILNKFRQFLKSNPIENNIEIHGTPAMNNYIKDAFNKEFQK